MDDSELKSQSAECILCGDGSFDIALTDVRVLHALCHDKVAEDETGLLLRIEKIDNLKLEYEATLRSLKRERASFTGLLGGFFRSRNFDAEIAELIANDPRERLHQEKQDTRKSVQTVRRKLADLYDFWPDYPPDWEERREAALDHYKHSCAECGVSRNLQIHHRYSLQRGGSNKADNLEVLCIDCHGREHRVDFREGRGSKTISEFGDKQRLIQEAIKKNRRLNFSYRKYEEKKNHKRTIRPVGFKQFPSNDGKRMSLCVHGHCELRNDTRVFALKRMSKLKML